MCAVLIIRVLYVAAVVGVVNLWLLLSLWCALLSYVRVVTLLLMLRVVLLCGVITDVMCVVIAVVGVACCCCYVGCACVTHAKANIPDHSRQYALLWSARAMFIIAASCNGLSV